MLHAAPTPTPAAAAIKSRTPGALAGAIATGEAVAVHGGGTCLEAGAAALLALQVRKRALWKKKK